MILRQNFAEYMAAQGAREVRRDCLRYTVNPLYKGNGTLNRQEAVDIADIARRKTALNPHESDVAAAIADR